MFIANRVVEDVPESVAAKNSYNMLYRHFGVSKISCTDRTRNNEGTIVTITKSMDNRTMIRKYASFFLI